MATRSKGSTDQAIGRPGPWREGRYQRSGQPLEQSVATEPPLDSKNPAAAPVKAKVAQHPKSTPVHLDEYTGAGGKRRRGQKPA